VTLGKQTLDFPVGLDGNFRIVDTGMSMGNNSEQSRVAAKGSWVDDKTFVVKFHILGDVVTSTFSMMFTDDKVSLSFGAISLTMIIGKTGK
jgi:hypothetical protein